MQFNQSYTAPYAKERPMEKQPIADLSPKAPYSAERQGQPDIEKPIFSVSKLGQSVTEGSRFGSLLQSATGAIRGGAGNVELQLQMGGGAEPVGAEVYGEEAREALREVAKANQVEFPSVHSPSQIGNLSGFAGPEKGFDDQQRKVEVDEIKTAIDFAADTSGKGAVVVHTGEYQRPISEQEWAHDDQGNRIFSGYEEEPEKAIIPLVDKRTGNVILQVRKNQIIARAKWNQYEEGNEQFQKQSGTTYSDDKGHEVRPGDYIDYEGNWVDFKDRVPEYDKENNTFVVRQQKWDDIEQEAKERTEQKARDLGISVEELPEDERVTPAEAFLYATTETQEKIAEGWAGNYAERLDDTFEYVEKLKKAKKVYEKVEAETPESEKWRLMKDKDLQGNLQNMGIVPVGKALPTELIDQALKKNRRLISDYREMVTGQKQQAEEQRITRENATPISKYAKEQSIKSYADVGVYAMKTSQSGEHVTGDIFVAPENIFPEMGFGSHPDEMIELVTKAREAMADKLVKEENYTKGEAEHAAESHIKATIDTQHLGMWRKNFVSQPGESKNETDDRFDKWYMEQVDKLQEKGIIGHMHIVDGFGRSHTHLPPGQGKLPIKDTLKYLKKKGYKGALISEGFAEGQFGPQRIITEFWKTAGAPVKTGYHSGPAGGGPKNSWTDIEHSYFGKTYSPYFIFGAYSPSNDWSLWSQVPME
tara:strand:- start:5406 stop:7520 length:2115 start_codon:yes stop_codon:yes gene_type:complete